MPLPSPLAELVAEFEGLPWELKLEYLADYAAQLPDDEQEDPSAPFFAVPECQTPLAYRVNVAADNTVQLAFRVAPHAVTAHGFLGLLYCGLNGVTRDELAHVDDDLADQLGLSTALSAQRLDGLRAVVRRVKHTALHAP